VAFEFAHFHDLFLSLIGVHILYLFDLFLSFSHLIIILGLTLFTFFIFNMGKRFAERKSMYNSTRLTIANSKL